MEELQKQLAELDARRKEILDKIEDEKPVLQKDILKLREELTKTLLARMSSPKSAPSSEHLPSGLVMTSINVHGATPWPKTDDDKSLLSVTRDHATCPLPS